MKHIFYAWICLIFSLGANAQSLAEKASDPNSWCDGAFCCFGSQCELDDKSNLPDLDPISFKSCTAACDVTASIDGGTCVMRHNKVYELADRYEQEELATPGLTNNEIMSIVKKWATVKVEADAQLVNCQQDVDDERALCAAEAPPYDVELAGPCLKTAKGEQKACSNEQESSLFALDLFAEYYQNVDMDEKLRAIYLAAIAKDRAKAEAEFVSCQQVVDMTEQLCLSKLPRCTK